MFLLHWVANFYQWWHRWPVTPHKRVPFLCRKRLQTADSAHIKTACFLLAWQCLSNSRFPSIAIDVIASWCAQYMMVSRTLGAVLYYHTHIAIQDCANVVDLVLAIHGIEHNPRASAVVLSKYCHCIGGMANLAEAKIFLLKFQFEPILR